LGGASVPEKGGIAPPRHRGDEWTDEKKKRRGGRC